MLAPQGSVALVFTDVEGSSALWDRNPALMREALAVHDRLMRDTLAAVSGYEVKTEGDAFMVAFASAASALRFCLEAQRSLAAATWPGGRELRVRMGVHVGEPEARPDPLTGRMDYFGPVVNRAARVASAAHGGQVLASGRAFREAAGTLGTAVARDLGLHRLKGLEAPERLVEVLPADLAGRRFGPPRTPDAPRTNATPPATSFVGRASDLAHLHARIDGGARLITLIGPGGTGKTRLAVELALARASRHDGGAWVCDLTEARSLHDVGTAIAAALSLPHVDGDVFVRVTEALAERGGTLLVLDNFEHLTALAPATVGRLIAPWLTLVVTSREKLRLGAEEVHELFPLGAAEAGELFVARARAVRGSYDPAGAEAAAVAELVRRLDGIPLAIELAAARMGVLSATGLLQRLARRLELTSGRRDAPARQATLRAAIDWSWDLLAEAERAALGQAAVFRGGFTVEAAEAVLALPAGAGVLEVIEALRDRSLLRAHPGGAEEPRLGMYETIRDYALEKLEERGEAEAARQRHAQYYLTLGAGLAFSHDLAALRRLAAEQDNLTAVLERALATGSAHQALAALLALDRVLATRGPFATHLPLLDRALALPGEVDPAIRLRALEARAHVRRRQALHQGAREDHAAAAALARQIGDTAAEARNLGALGMVDHEAGHLERARAAYEQALAASDEKPQQARFRANLSTALADLGDVAGSLAHIEQALALLREAGYQRWEGYFLTQYAILLQELGRLDQALATSDAALAATREADDLRSASLASAHRGDLLAELRRLPEARQAYLQGVSLLRACGDLRLEAYFLGGLAAVEAAQGDAAAARAALARAAEFPAPEGPVTRALAVHRARAELILDPATRPAAEAAAASARALGHPPPSTELRLALRLIERELA